MRYGASLTISQHFCRMMGGEIRVESQAGQGSTFEVVLPRTVVNPNPLALKPIVPVVALPNPAKTILLIDDDPTTQNLMARLLGKEGFQVESALRGKEGLEKARSLHPTAIILDVSLPDMDGWTVLTRLKTDPELQDIPVIMVTMVDDKAMGFALGATAYLTKPLDRQRLVTLLEPYCMDDRQGSILLVEDDPTSRRLVRRILEQEGWAVLEAKDGHEALEYLNCNHPDLILLDLIMPEVSGFEVIRSLQQRPEWRSIPLIVLTSKILTPEDRLQLHGCVEKIVQKGAYGREELLKEVHHWVAACAKK